MARLRIEAFFVILLLFVVFACGQRSATTSRSAGGATAPPAQFEVLQAERDFEGNLTSPGFPENYPNRRNITWRIEADNGDMVHLAFDYFDLESSQVLMRNCIWDYVAVYDGTNKLKDKFCGTELPPEQEFSSVLSVTFVSDATVSKSGFSARYWASEIKFGCPKADYNETNGVCYKYFLEAKTYGQAKETCAADGGLLAMPKDDQTNNLINSLGSGNRWIGLTDVAKEDEWVFEDGQTLESNGYSNWNPAEPNGSRGENYAALSKTGPGWEDWPGNSTMPFTCQIGCPKADYNNFNGVCYKYFLEAKTYFQAKQTCATDGGLLAMPKDDQTNNLINSLGSGYRWIGLTDFANEGQWVFEDGQTLESNGYSNWNPAEPNGSRVENFAALSKTGPGWEDWNGNLAMPFTCQIESQTQLLPERFDVPDEFYNYCKDLDFDSVAIPNFYGHKSVPEILASRQWQEMKTVDRSCHHQIQPFLCSLLMPRYTTRKELPCQSWCREVKSSCSSDGSLFEAIDCTSLPITECVNLEPPEDCYYGNGENYKGVRTLPDGSGKTCLSWTNVLDGWGPNKSEWDWVDHRENYCRNLGKDFYPYQEPYCIGTVFGGEEYVPIPCSLKPCDEPGCILAPSVISGSISPVQNFYRVGETVSISCDVGYVIENDDDVSITCTGDGRWSREAYELRCTFDYTRQLTDTLLASERYSPQLAPSRNQVSVIFEAAVVEIIDADEKNENMFASIAFRLRWRDSRLSWTPRVYGGESRLVLSQKKVWIPNVFLQRNGDASFSDFPEAPVTVNSDGLVEWDIIDLLTTTCDLNPALFPFDTMDCPVCLGANTRVESFHCPKSDDNRISTEQNTYVGDFKACGEESVDVADQWNVRWTISVDEGEFGRGCINMKFDRDPTFHFCTTLFPIIILSLLMCMTFVLPIKEGDRISFGMTILLAMVVSLVFITEVLPAKGSMPAVALLIILYMCMMGFFLVVTVIVIRINSKDEKLPSVVETVFLRYAARLVFLGDLSDTVKKNDDSEMKSMTGNDSIPSQAELDHLFEGEVPPSRTVGTSTENEPVKDYAKLARVLDRLCLALYVCGLIILIPIVTFSR